MSRLKVKRNKGPNRIEYVVAGGAGSETRARGRTRAGARARGRGGRSPFQVGEGPSYFVNSPWGRRFAGVWAFGTEFALLFSLLFCLLFLLISLLFCCLVCWSVCPSFIGHPTRVRFPVLSTGPLPTTFPPYHPLHTSFSPFYRAVVLLWSTSPR